MPIMRITRLENHSRHTVALLNIENPATTGHGEPVAAGGPSIPVDMSVPWAAAAENFPRQHLEMQVNGVTRFWIWQAAKWDGDHLRYSRNGQWTDPGPRLHGASIVDRNGGVRTLVVHDDCLEAVAMPDELARDLMAWLPAPQFRPDATQPVDPMRASMPSVPRRTATAFGMAGPPSDALRAGAPNARFGYTDSGKRYAFAIRADGVVTATHPDGTITELRKAISYDEFRRGREHPAPIFDIVAANDTRVIAKARNTNDLYFATMDDLFVHGDDTGFQVAVPSIYFKIDPEWQRDGRNVADITKHMAGCFADHPAVERLPLFRLVLSLDLANTMVVRVQPRVWHLIDARPPLPFEALLPIMTIAESALGRIEAALPPWLDGARKELGTWQEKARLEPEKLNDPNYDPYALPGRVTPYDHVRYTNGTLTLTFHSIRYHRVLDLGVGHAHWHAVYDGSTGGEMQPMRTGPAIGPLSSADLYRVLNGPIRDGDGYIDGTANFYALVQLKPDDQLPPDSRGARDGLGVADAYGVLFIDEQTHFSGRWRLLHPDDHIGGGSALAAALVNDREREDPLYDWNPDTYFCPFRAGHIGRRSRMATSRQVVVVNGVDTTSNTPCLYSINFSYSSMDRTWRWRPLPSGATVAYFADDAAAGAETLPPPSGDVVYPETLRLREDMTLHMRGSKGGVAGRWFQRYLPAGNALVPDAGALLPGRPADRYRHPWKFMAETAFAVADRFSHFGVYDNVDGRSQYYELRVSPEAAAVLDKSVVAKPWLDEKGQLFTRALKFWWAAPTRPIDLDPAVDTLPLRPTRKVPPSLMNSISRLRIAKRGASWIATQWDKRDDDLMPFDPQEDWLGLPADPQPTVRLTQEGRAVDVVVGRNVQIEKGPVVNDAEFVWTGDTAMPVAVRLRAPRDVWRVRLGAIRPATATQPAQVVHLLSADMHQFQSVDDGVMEHRWKPSDAQLADLRLFCSAAGAAQHGTSLWVEDMLGKVVVPDRLAWLHAMTATAQPSNVPIGMPVTMTVTARNLATGAAIDGTVEVSGTMRGRTGAPFTTTFAMERVKVFDPTTRQYVFEDVFPTMTVRADGALPTNVALSFYLPELRVSVDQQWLPIGRAAQVTVRAVDAVTGVAVNGRVVLNGVDVGATNTPFNYTCGNVAPSGVVTATNYPNAGIAWPALRMPRLVVSAQPSPMPLRTAVSVLIRATDADSGAAIDGAVVVNGATIGRTNVAFTYTFVPTRTRVFDPETRRYVYVESMPTGVVTAPGYAQVPIEFGW